MTEAGTASVSGSAKALAADFDTQTRQLEFRLTTPSVLGPSATVKIGDVVVIKNGQNQRLSIDVFKRVSDFSVSATSSDGGTELSREQFDGQFLEAITLQTPDEFLAKVQLNHSRYGHKDLLTLAARSSFLRFADDFVVRTSALTILAHRILEKDFKKLNGDDEFSAKWIRDRAPDLIAKGLAEMKAADKPNWTTVRWTISLATVTGYLCLIGNDTKNASRHFSQVARLYRLVGVSKVSALNIVNGCFMAGLLAQYESKKDETKKDEAKTHFERGVLFFKDAVVAQNLLENVWVVGDLLNVGRASRQCYIALGIFDLLPPREIPRLDPNSTISISEIKSPLRQILQAGLAPDLLKFFETNAIPV